MTTDQHTTQDPTTQHPDSLPADQLEHPGLEQEMSHAPDFGEETYRGSGRLQGRKAVVTGGDSGIGRAVALAFAREGADVVISYLEEEQSDADETARVVRDAGRTALQIPGDLQDEGYCRTLVERTAQELGGVDILVNNAAYQMARDGLADISSAELERTFRTNILAMFHTCRAALEHMQAGATIINTGSIQAYQPDPMLLAYAATKAAIVNFTKGLAQETVERGIRVNAVAPGPIWTPLIPATMPEDKVEGFGAEESPMQRAGQPAQLAPVYVFLASQESSYVNGEVIGVTGGSPLSCGGGGRASALERGGELLLRHRRAALDAALLRALVELVAALLLEVAVVVARLAASVALGGGQALLERGHQVGDRRGLVPVVGQRDALALLLALDDLEQALAVAIVVARRVPVLRHRLDQRGGPVEPVLGRLAAAAGDVLGRPQLVVEQHRGQREQAVADADRDEVLLRAHHEAPEGRAVGLLHHLDQQLVGAPAALGLALRQQEVRVIEVGGVDVDEVDERLDVDRAGLARGGGREVLVGQHDLLPVVELVAVADVLEGDLLVLVGAEAAGLDRRAVLL